MTTSTGQYTSCDDGGWLLGRGSAALSTMLAPYGSTACTMENANDNLVAYALGFAFIASGIFMIRQYQWVKQRLGWLGHPVFFTRTFLTVEGVALIIVGLLFVLYVTFFHMPIQ